MSTHGSELCLGQNACALKRALMTEHHQALKKTVISVLLDMSNFFDRISPEKLAERWIHSDYTLPPMSPWQRRSTVSLEAEGEASGPIWTSHGILRFLWRERSTPTGP